MNRKLVGVLALLTLMAAPLAGAWADTLTLAPTQAVVLPADRSGVTKVALKYDLSAMREGADRFVAAAVLDWRISGITSGERVTFTAHEPTTSWTATGIGAGTLPTISEDAMTEWDLEDLDYSRLGGFMRLNLTELVDGWAAGTTPNLGIVVETPDLSGNTLSSELQKAQLTVYYGFGR